MYIRAPVVCLILTLQNTAAKRSAYGISGSSRVHPRRHRRSPVFCCSVRSHSSCDAHTQLISFQKPGPRQIRTSWKGGAHDLRPCFLELHLVYQEPVPEIKDQWCESMLLLYLCRDGGLKMLQVLLLSIWGYGRERNGILGNLLNTHPMALTHLMPALMHFYIGKSHFLSSW